ncbi:hypothetical protein V1478_000153 [Vespula squamosa]|uniref:Uncharacterized protein n=1 Tax=Vespula squamosa TaxID=30214 RepID=A0ABD2C8S7_VESSQ
MFDGKDLSILLDFLQGCLPGWKEKDIPYAYGSKLRTKLDEIHKITKERMKIKSNENKAIEKFSRKCEYGPTTFALQHSKLGSVPKGATWEKIRNLRENT